jgi:phosphate starvation-inducible PhoH-like protein
MVVTGDVTQVDLPVGQASGLRLVQDILEGVEDIQFVRLTSHDVVRHRLVGDIVNAYAAYEARTAPDGRPLAGAVRDGAIPDRTVARGTGRAHSRGPGKRAQ